MILIFFFSSLLCTETPFGVARHRKQSGSVERAEMTCLRLSTEDCPPFLWGAGGGGETVKTLSISR